MNWMRMCLMAILLLSTARLIHLKPSQHVHHNTQKRYSCYGCYSCMLERLDLISFMASRVVAGGANQKRERRYFRKCPSCGQRLQHNKTLSFRSSFLGKPFRYASCGWCLDRLEPLSASQIKWTRDNVAAVALLPRSHLAWPTSIARGSYA